MFFHPPFYHLRTSCEPHCPSVPLNSLPSPGSHALSGAVEELLQVFEGLRIHKHIAIVEDHGLPHGPTPKGRRAAGHMSHDVGRSEHVTGVDKWFVEICCSILLWFCSVLSFCGIQVSRLLNIQMELRRRSGDRTNMRMDSCLLLLQSVHESFNAHHTFINVDRK